ncbi:MAG: protease modulator HflK, partial [Kistimonas sp.]|nr:protease modulator HflK [Kistimonas sp.]
MAWNEPGDNNQNPWGGKRGGNQGPPDLEEVFRKLQIALGRLLGLGKVSGGRDNRSGSGAPSSSLWVGIALLAGAIYIWNAIYVVDERERAVVLRLGKYVETVGPGLRIYFPPFESRYKRAVTQISTYRISQAMLTEDENIVEVAMSVQYNISNLENYVLKDANPEQSLREATQSALRHVVGGSRMYKVLTEGREVLGEEIK